MAKYFTLRKLWLGFLGLSYAGMLTTLGALSSGGGHFNLIIMLGLAPLGLGLIIWPIIWYLSEDMKPIIARRLFVALIGLHYVGLVIYLVFSLPSEHYWLGVASEYPSIIILSALGICVYIVGQLFLWSRFLRETTQGLLR